MSVSGPSPSVALAPVEPPPRRPLVVLLPIAVIVATAALVGWTAWPTIRPVRQVTVVQVLPPTTSAPDPSGGSSTDAALVAAPAAAPGVTVQAPGWLEADPFFVAVAALQSGTVAAVEVLEGDAVVAGQVIARLIPDDVELQQRRAVAELATAVARRDLAAADFAAAEADFAEPVELERAVAAELANVAEADAELAQLPALIEAARADLRRLEEERDRAIDSGGRGGATPLELVIARERAAAQRATVASIVAQEARIAARRERHAANHRAAVRALELKTEPTRRRDAGRAALARAEADVTFARVRLDEADLAVDRTIIRAPIDGVVLRRHKVPGDTVMREMDDLHAAHLAHLYDPASLQVRVDVPLADAAHVAVGQVCEVVVDVLPDRIFRGTVTRITHEADLQKNTLQVKVRVIDPSPLLRPEMLTRVKFLPGGGNGAATGSARRPVLESPGPAPDGRAQASVRIPASALTGDGTVYAVRQRRGDRGVIESVAVDVGVRDGAWIVADAALRPGDLLVDDPRGASLAVGAMVRFRAAGASADDADAVASAAGGAS